MAESWPKRIKAMRAQLKVSQFRFAALLGFATRSVTSWETGEGSPRGFNAAVLHLAENAIRLHSRKALVRALWPAAADPVKVIRVLAWLERHPSVPLPPPPRLTAPPPSSGPPSSVA